MDTCPKTHLRLEKGRGTRERASGWEKKNKASTEAETSDNIRKRMNLLSICQLTMHVTCIAVSLDQLEPKRAHETSERLAAVFVCPKTQYGPKQIIVTVYYHVHETTLIVLLGLR